MDRLVNLITAFAPGANIEDLMTISLQKTENNPDYNTIAKVAYSQTTSFYGSFTVYYNRLDLGKTVREIKYNGETKASQLLNKLNVTPITTFERYDGTQNVFLQAEDIADINIVMNPGSNPTVINIPSLDTSVMFTGSIKVTLLP